MSELLAVFILFGVAIVWFSLPFLPTMIEMRERTEARPLSVDRENDGEVRHFARRFKTYLESNFRRPPLRESVEQGVGLEGRFEDGTPYRVVGKTDDYFSQQARGPQSVTEIIVFSGPAGVPDSFEFVHGIYAADNIECGRETLIRSLYGERDVRLAERCAVLRWLYAENELVVGEGSSLYGRASAEAGMRLGAHVEFERLHARRIVFEGGRAPVPSNVLSYIPLTPAQVRATRMSGNCYSVDDDLDVPPQTVIRGDFVVRGAVRIGRHARIEGSIKSHQDMRMADGVFVDGSVISGRDLEIGGDCRIRGPVVASRTLRIRTGCEIGQPTYATSAIAPSIFVEPGVLVFGTVWARIVGKCCDIL
jgi:cytoskeletal protein CcmA (bactofilin family)